MATIKIDRTSEWMNRARDYKIYIDDVKVGAVGNGGSESFEVPSGMHTVYAKIDWCYSPTINFMVSDTEKKCFTVGAFKGAKWASPVLFVVILIYFGFRSTVAVDFIPYLGIPIFLIMGYFITFGRKQYLRFTEETSVGNPDLF